MTDAAVTGIRRGSRYRWPIHEALQRAASLTLDVSVLPMLRTSLLILAVSLLCTQQLRAGGVVVLLDRSAGSLHGERALSATDPLPRHGELSQWQASSGIRAGAVAAHMAAGLVGYGIGDRAQQAARDAELESLRTALEVEQRLQERVFEQLRAVVEAQLGPVARLVHGENIGAAGLNRIEREADVQLGLAVVRHRGLPLVSLSFDNRRLLVRAKVELYRLGRGRARLQQSRVVHYASAQVDAVDALQYWQDLGASEVETRILRGLQLVLEEGLAPAEDDLPRVGRNEDVGLMYFGEYRRFHARTLAIDDARVRLLLPGREIGLLEMRSSEVLATDQADHPRVEQKPPLTVEHP